MKEVCQMFRRGEGEDRHQEPIDPKEVLMKETPGSEVTVIGQGARIEGTLVSAGSLRIDGRVTGKINADGDVVLSSQSQVEADIDAQNATVAGRFKGNINVKNKAELAKGGRVEGNITSKILAIAEGATFSGQSIMDQQGGQGGSSGRGQVARVETSDGEGAFAGDAAARSR
jgi:cytoskeletal protein CcmA (bactofilin family)